MNTRSFEIDNVDVNSPYYVHREEKAKQILKDVEEKGVVLIRAGFFSGKTSFVHSLRREAEKIYGDMICSFTALHFGKAVFDDFGKLVSQASGLPGSGKEMTAETFDALCLPSSTSKPCLIIIDEAQVRLVDPAFVQPPSMIQAFLTANRCFTPNSPNSGQSR